MPSGRAAATPVRGRRPGRPTWSPGSGLRSAARALDGRATPPQPSAPAAGRADMPVSRSSRKPPSKFLEPVAAGREHDVVGGQSSQLGCDARATLALDRCEALAHLAPRGVDLYEISALRVNQRELADVRQPQLARVA